MKRLILMRHAKSDWSDIALSDHERLLNARGKASAAAIGDWLRTNDLQPDQILCSDAARTRETLALLGLRETATEFSRALYLAEPAVMFDALRRQTGACVLMLAHNPGSAILAEQLLQSEPDHPQFATFPTCATLVAGFDITDWSDLRMQTGQTEYFVVPRELTE